MKFIVIRSLKRWGYQTEYFNLDDLIYFDHDQSPHCIFLKFKNFKKSETFCCDLKKGYKFDHNNFELFLSSPEETLFNISCCDLELFEDEEES